MDIKVNNYYSNLQVNTEKLRIDNGNDESSSVKMKERADKVVISPEGRKFSGDKQKQINNFWAEHDALYADQTASAMEKVTDGMETALEIYRRIAGGSKVSPEDEQFLMLYSRPMYMAAKNAQEMKEKKEDMSDESLIRKFEERHANDRRDWTTELDEAVTEMNQSAAEEPRISAEQIASVPDFTE